MANASHHHSDSRWQLDDGRARRLVERKGRTGNEIRRLRLSPIIVGTANDILLPVSILRDNRDVVAASVLAGSVGLSAPVLDRQPYYRLPCRCYRSVIGHHCPQGTDLSSLGQTHLQ